MSLVFSIEPQVSMTTLVSSRLLVPNFTSTITDDLSQFLSMLRFEHRERVAELAIKLDTL
jgi:hypothetical protein